MVKYITAASFVFCSVFMNSVCPLLACHPDELILCDYESPVIPVSIDELGIKESVETKFKEYKSFNKEISYYLNKYISLVETLQDLCTKKSRDQLNNIIANTVYNEVEGLRKKYGDKFIDQLFDSPEEIPAFIMDNIKGVVLQIVLNLPGLEGIKETLNNVFISDNQLSVEGESVDIQRGLCQRAWHYGKSCVKSSVAKHAAPFIAHAFYKMDIAGRLQENVFEELLDRVLQRKSALVKMLHDGVELIEEEMGNIEYNFKSIDRVEMRYLVENYSDAKSKVDEAYVRYNKYLSRINKDKQRISQQSARIKKIQGKMCDINDEIEASENPGMLQKVKSCMPRFIRGSSVLEKINEPEINELKMRLAHKNNELEDAKIQVEIINQGLAKFKNIQEEITRINLEIEVLKNPGIRQKTKSFVCGFVYSEYVINKINELEKLLVDKNNELEDAEIDEETVNQNIAKSKRIQDEVNDIKKEILSLENLDKDSAVNKIKDYRTVKNKKLEKAKMKYELSELSIMVANPQKELDERMNLYKSAKNEEDDIEKKIIVVQEYAYNLPMLQAAKKHLNDGLIRLERLDIQTLDDQGKVLESIFPGYTNPCQEIESKDSYDWILYIAYKPANLYLNWFGAVEPLLNLERLLTKDLLGVMDKTCCTLHQMSVTYKQKANGLMEYLMKAISLSASAIDLGLTYNNYCRAIKTEIDKEKFALNKAASYPSELITKAFKNVEDYYCDPDYEF